MRRNGVHKDPVKSAVAAIEFAQFLLAALRQQLQSLDETRAFNLTINLTEDRHAESLRDLPQTEILSWLAARGYDMERREVVYRQILRAAHVQQVISVIQSSTLQL